MLTRWEASKAKYCTAIVGQRSAVEGCCELEGVFVSEVTRLRICQLLFLPGAKVMSVYEHILDKQVWGAAMLLEQKQRAIRLQQITIQSVVNSYSTDSALHSVIAEETTSQRNNPDRNAPITHDHRDTQWQSVPFQCISTPVEDQQ